MLSQLLIKNIALIQNQTLEFDDGFNVLSGETGAGKSIIIDALNLVLGERADKELIRSGEQKALVEGIFNIENNLAVKEILEENGIDVEDDMLIIVRQISIDGKSICRINGNAVTLATLKKVADKLADIHGQHEHQLLLSVDSHLSFLDSFAGKELLKQKENVRLAHTYYKTCLEKLNGDWGSEEERAQRVDMLEYQIKELTNAQISVGQEEELIKKREMLVNVDKIKAALYSSAQLVSNSALDSVRAASSELAQIADSGYQELFERVESAFYELEDVANEAYAMAESVEADPFELERIEERLSEIKKLYRKYAPDEEGLIKYLHDAEDELDSLVNAEETIEALKGQAQKFKAEFDKQAAILTEMRHDAAIEFEDRIKEELAELGMKNAAFEVDFSNEQIFSSEGVDKIEFLFSANAGEGVKPLYKIISGGEMSRFMLAIKSIAAREVTLPVMVFDEIDTGISGEGASVVAKKMAKLAKKHQIISITHLPQIASMADRHFLIKKISDGFKTHTEVNVIVSNDRKSEIARLAGGNETELAIKRAEEILIQAKQYKEKL